MIWAIAGVWLLLSGGVTWIMAHELYDERLVILAALKGIVGINAIVLS